ncbi:hypothetical protein N7540_000794 [Penicillium herquei]|nr:hypothetical protein N7540_000794 [Penicillium herquei]
MQLFNIILCLAAVAYAVPLENSIKARDQCVKLHEQLVDFPETCPSGYPDECSNGGSYTECCPSGTC